MSRGIKTTVKTLGYTRFTMKMVNNMSTNGTVPRTHKRIQGRLVRCNGKMAGDAYRTGYWTTQTLADALRKAAERTPDRLLIVDERRGLDCATLWKEACSVAAGLMRIASRGDVVSFMLPNWHEAAVIYMGATLAGMVVHPILPNLRERELEHMLRDSRSRVLFTPETYAGFSYVAMTKSVIEEMQNPPRHFVVRGDGEATTAYETLLAISEVPVLPRLDSEAVRMVLYTSGTTGTPKGVMHSHNSLHALTRQIGENWLIETGDRFLVPSPISHIGGSIYAFEAPLLLETTAYLMDRWNAPLAASKIDDIGISHMAGATPFLTDLLSASRAAGSRLPSLKLFICGGASVPPPLVNQAVEYFQRAIVTRVYGSTEVPVTTIGVLDRSNVQQAAETDGITALAHVRLADHPSAGPGEGEILAMGPQMLVGYLHLEDEHALFDADGYYRTGDIGRFEDGRYLVVSGRAKDIVIRNGENISPKEIEDILLSHPGIREVAVVGIPSERTGECAVAVIVSGVAPPPDLPSIKTYLQQRGIAKFKWPEMLVLWDALPKNAAGKVLKHEIRRGLTTTTGGN